jgi:hypothetical protein
MGCKICRVCKVEKDFNEYNTNKRNRDNLSNMCKECGKIYYAKYRKDNYKKVLEKEKEYELKNKNKREEYRDKNKEKINTKMRKYIFENKEKIKNSINNSKRKRYKTDSTYRLKETIRKSISSSIKRNGYTKKLHTKNILGCSFEQFKQHIESLFESWMNWDNYGNPKDGILEPNKTWDIDHIIPSSSATTEEELSKLNYYTNLQPLCSYYNRLIKKNLILNQ